MECDRCGHQLRPEEMLEHRAVCQGKCESCQKQRIPCVFPMLTKDTCKNCREQGLAYNGPVTHTDINVLVERPCPRCGRLLQVTDARMSLHEIKCNGKCTRCRDLGLACLKAGHGCKGCSEVGIICSGAITHKHLVVASGRASTRKRKQKPQPKGKRKPRRGPRSKPGPKR